MYYAKVTVNVHPKEKSINSLLFYSNQSKILLLQGLIIHKKPATQMQVTRNIQRCLTGYAGLSNRSSQYVFLSNFMAL